MSDAHNEIFETIDDQHTDRSAATRRQLVAGAGATLGALGLMGLPSAAMATHRKGHTGPNTPENILNIAATAEVLATIVNTVGPEKLNLDATTRANIQAAAREELIHYDVLTSQGIGAKAVTKRIWVPDAVFASQEALLGTLVVGDQVFVNAYLIGVTVFGRSGGNAGGRLARIAAEFMGVELVHRALALQSLGLLGNDRVFAKFGQKEEVQGLPTTGQPGFYEITEAVTILEGAGFGFGKQGSAAGAFYEFDEVRQRTPDPAGVNTRTPS